MAEFDFDNREMVTEKLKELKDRNIPKMSLDKLLEMDEYRYLKPYAEEATEEELKECNEILSQFCEQGYNDGKDIFSDEKCVFYWGLKYGVMVTDDNGLNRMQYHSLPIGGKRHEISILLQYHPDCYEIEG